MKPDPIFALIEAHRAAEADFRLINEARDKLDTKIDDADKARFAKEGKIPAWHQLTTSNDAFIYVGGHCIRSPEEIPALVKQVFHIGHPIGPCATERLLAGMKAAEREIRSMLFQAQKARRTAQDAAGWTAMCAAWEAAEDASSRAMRKLCATKPTTPEGLLAMFSYLRPTMDTGADPGSFTDKRTDNLFKTLEASIGAMVAGAAKRKASRPAPAQPDHHAIAAE